MGCDPAGFVDNVAVDGKGFLIGPAEAEGKEIPVIPGSVEEIVDPLFVCLVNQFLYLGQVLDIRIQDLRNIFPVLDADVLHMVGEEERYG